jgi:nucleoid DNA-binding protein
LQIIRQQGRIDYGNLVKAIANSDSAIRENITSKQVDIVLQVFSQCVLKACENDVTVVVNNLGNFKSKRKIGYKGRWFTRLDKTTNQKVAEWIPTKPDYRLIDFSIADSLIPSWREKTSFKLNTKRKDVIPPPPTNVDKVIKK